MPLLWHIFRLLRLIGRRKSRANRSSWRFARFRRLTPFMGRCRRFDIGSRASRRGRPQRLPHARAMKLLRVGGVNLGGPRGRPDAQASCRCACCWPQRHRPAWGRRRRRLLGRRRLSSGPGGVRRGIRAGDATVAGLAAMVAGQGAIALDLAPTALLAGQRRAAPLLRGRGPLGLFGLFGHLTRAFAENGGEFAMTTLNECARGCNRQSVDESILAAASAFAS